MTKEMWCRVADSLREYWNWENQLYNMGIDLTDSAPGGLADTMLLALANGDTEWAYDSAAEINWLAVWCSEFKTVGVFNRTVNGRIEHVYLPEADWLCDFICEMRELGWPEELPEKWRPQYERFYC